MSVCFARAALAVLSASLSMPVLAAQQADETNDHLFLHLEETVRVADVKRFGVNLSAHNNWGAAQVMKNLLENPGFESGIYGMVVHCGDTSTGDRITQEFWSTAWNNDSLGIGQPEGFWDGGDWEIVYGPAAGRSGSIIEYVHENDEPIFVLDSNGTVPSPYDVMFVRNDIPGLDHAGEFAFAAPGVTRPGSPGAQSMRLVSSGVSWKPSWAEYMDSLWPSEYEAGKLLIVEGRWRLDFWARASAAGTPLRMVFKRHGEATFLDETVTLGEPWTRIVRTFDVAPGTDPTGPYDESGPHPILHLEMLLPDEGTEVYIDDCYFGRSDHTNPTVFADPLVDRLRQLRPGILRNFSEVHGCSLGELLAEPFARRSHGYGPDERVPDAMDYGLHEFLDLCAFTDAEPWVILPVVLSTSDLVGLVEYLAGPADGSHPWADLRASRGRQDPWTDEFETIHLEYGNEAWGGADASDPYFGSSLLGGIRLGSIADARLAALRSSPDFDPQEIRLIIGGQAEFVGRQGEIESTCDQHTSIALAPYFARKLNDFATEAEQYLPLWAHAREDVDPGGKVRASQELIESYGHGTDISVYELNFNTIRSHAGLPLELRESYVAGASGAIALPLYMLHYLSDLGIKNQCAFQALEFNTSTVDGDKTALFGILRDLYGTGRVRPTFLGLELVNRALHGDHLDTSWTGPLPTYTQTPLNDVETTVTFPLVQAYAFGDSTERSLVLINLDLSTQHTVHITGHQANPPVARVTAVVPTDLHQTNEDEHAVDTLERVIPLHPGTATHLPAHSIALLQWSK